MVVYYVALKDVLTGNNNFNYIYSELEACVREYNGKVVHFSQYMHAFFIKIPKPNINEVQVKALEEQLSKLDFVSVVQWVI